MMRPAFRRPLILLTLALLQAVAVGEDDPPAEMGKLTVRGVVRDPQGRPMSWVRLEAGEQAQVTRPDGGFSFSGLPRGRVKVRVSLYGVGGGPQPDRFVWVTAGDQRLVITVDPGPQLVVRAKNAKFLPCARSPWDEPCGVPSGARLFIRSDTRYDRWSPTVEDGALRFRRVLRGRPWTLYVPLSDDVKGTALVSGRHLRGGRMCVELEKGAPITGTIIRTRPDCWYPSYPDGHRSLVYEAWACRGPVRVRGAMEEDGSLRFPRLPSGTWKVVAYFACRVGKKSYYMLATESAEAGKTVRLVPRSVSRDEFAEARRTVYATK